MKTIATIKVLVLLLACSAAAVCQTTSISKPENKNPMETKEMKMYVIERQIPGAGKLSAADLKGISQTSCSVLKEMGPQIEWVHSYVTDDKIFCIYRATSEEALRTHAKKGGFPINSIYPVANTISPATAL